MLSTIETINQVVNDFIWGVPAMVCIIGVGFYLSCRTSFLQIRKFSYAIQTTIGRMFRKRNASDGALTPFQAVIVIAAPSMLMVAPSGMVTEYVSLSSPISEIGRAHV